MKNVFKRALIDYMSDCLASTRKEKQLTQAEFSERLMIDTRTYGSLERGESLCGTMTLIIFLCLVCDDPNVLIGELREVLIASLKGANNAI